MIDMLTRHAFQVLRHVDTTRPTWRVSSAWAFGRSGASTVNPTSHRSTMRRSGSGEPLAASRSLAAP
jgi:hypothetical protein